jgi:hypothetical protein
MEIAMEQDYKEYDRYQRAKKQVEEIKGFYGHLVSFLAVNAFLLFINLKYSPQELWFFWPLLGWGIGLILHGMKAFNYMPFLGKEWEAKKLKQFLEEEKRQQHGNQ